MSEVNPPNKVVDKIRQTLFEYFLTTPDVHVDAYILDDICGRWEPVECLFSMVFHCMYSGGFWKKKSIPYWVTFIEMKVRKIESPFYDRYLFGKVLHM